MWWLGREARDHSTPIWPLSKGSEGPRWGSTGPRGPHTPARLPLTDPAIITPCNAQSADYGFIPELSTLTTPGAPSCCLCPHPSSLNPLGMSPQSLVDWFHNKPV